MENIFIHDAVPTWSGFIYQGEIAIYLAVKKICDLKEYNKLEIDEIGISYQIEVEYCEDIAIVQVDKTGKNYLSIHQVKNQKDKNIGAYRSPLVQLMLEKGFHIKGKSGNPEAYLHVSNKICESNENEIYPNLEKWKESILNFYNDLKILILSIGVDCNEIFIQKIKKIVHEEPIKLNRSEYNRELIKKIEDICNKENIDSRELKRELQNLINFLEKKLGVDVINKDVQVYQYEDGNMYCFGNNVFLKIIEQIKRYKQNDSDITSDQYAYIADMLQHHMRKFVVNRHKSIQDGKKYEICIPFSDIINILNDSLENSEAKANILALRRLYDETLVQHCNFVCQQECSVEENENKKCYLQQVKNRRADLTDEEFKKLCYSFNPNCNKTIYDRGCLSSLLDKEGLHKSVFEILKNIPEQKFIDNNKTRFIIDNESNNAFLTAISNSISSIVVDDIVQGIENNAELISPIFEADQIITTQLEADKSIWENNYCEIQKKYRRTETEKSKDSEESDQNSICIPKKPEFIKAEDIIKNCFNLELTRR